MDKPRRRRFQGLRDFWLVPPPRPGRNFVADAEGIWAILTRVGVILAVLLVGGALAWVNTLIVRGTPPF